MPRMCKALRFLGMMLPLNTTKYSSGDSKYVRQGPSKFCSNIYQKQKIDRTSTSHCYIRFKLVCLWSPKMAMIGHFTAAVKMIPNLISSEQE